MPILKSAFWRRSEIDKRLYRTYVETGTYRGHGIREVLNKYAAIHSIEISKRWYDHCVAEFANFDHVNLYLGNSVEFLPIVLDKIDEPAVIFLDAHYSGRSTVRSGGDTPLLDELEIVGRRPYPDIIIIDDTSFLGRKGGSEPMEPAADDEPWPLFAYDWSDVTNEAVLARLKPGYALVTNEHQLMTSSARGDQYIQYPMEPTGSDYHRVRCIENATDKDVAIADEQMTPPIESLVPREGLDHTDTNPPGSTNSKTKSGTRAPRPRRLPHIREFSVKNELVLVAPGEPAGLLDDGANNRALTLNHTGRAIWELCDGSHTAADMVVTLAARFTADTELLSRQIDDLLTRFSKLGFLDGGLTESATGTRTTFVIGIVDKPYFWWQTAIFLESLSGKMPADWRTFMVVCNNGEPLSNELANILSVYGTEFAQGTNHENVNRIDIGYNGGQCYSALNRVEALSVAAGHVEDGEMICLLDSDIFLYGDLNVEIMPTRCAAPKNWHIEKDVFFTSVDKNEGRGVDLQKLLEAIGCDTAFQPGGVNVFVKGDVARNKKYIADCFRFAHAVFLLGQVAGAKNTWMAEMPCFTLAMTANNIPYDLLERKEFMVSDCTEPSIPDGTLYHYYCDPGDFGNAAFRDSKWHKQAYRQENFLRTDFSQFAAEATTDHERYFFYLANRARERLYV